MLLVLVRFPGVGFVSCSDDAQQLESQDTDAVRLLFSFLNYFVHFVYKFVVSSLFSI